MIERKGLAVYFNDPNGAKALDKNIIDLYYYSERNNYAVIYFDKNRENQVVEQLKQNRNVESFTDILSGVENYSF